MLRGSKTGLHKRERGGVMSDFDIDDLREGLDEGGFEDDDLGGYEDFGGEETAERSGFTATERLIVVGLVFLNVLAALFLTWVLVLR
jgi:hypothetical protein